MGIYLPMPGPYHPDAGPPLGAAPGALTTNNYLNQQFGNVLAFDQSIAASTPPPNNNLLFPGSPLDFAQNYLNPNIANVNSQINDFLAQYPPGQPGQPGAVPAGAEGGGDGGGFSLLNTGAGIAGGAAVGAAIGTFVPIPGVGTATGAVIGGIVGGIASLF